MSSAAPAPRLEVRYDEGRHPRAKIGYVLLATEQTVQDDVCRLTPAGVGVHFSRAPIPDSITRDTLLAMAPRLGEAAALMLPDGSLDVVCYACTSGSVVIGEERVAAELRKGAPAAKATTLVTGVIAALRALGARRIAVATPYVEEINRIEEQYLRQAGFDVPGGVHGLGIERDSDMVRVAPDFIAELAASVDRPDAEAVFISCGALRSIDVVDRIERDLGKPVVVSNQAMIWHTLRLAGVDDRLQGYGRLLREH